MDNQLLEKELRRLLKGHDVTLAILLEGGSCSTQVGSLNQAEWSRITSLICARLRQELASVSSKIFPILVMNSPVLISYVSFEPQKSIALAFPLMTPISNVLSQSAECVKEIKTIFDQPPHDKGTRQLVNEVTFKSEELLDSITPQKTLEESSWQQALIFGDQENFTSHLRKTKKYSHEDAFPESRELSSFQIKPAKIDSSGISGLLSSESDELGFTDLFDWVTPDEEESSKSSDTSKPEWVKILA